MDTVDTIKIAFLVIIFLIFFSTIFYYLYETITTQSDKKYQLIYYLNHPKYNRGNKFRRKGNFYCPRGCNDKGQCKHGGQCFNCKKDRPHCCCYDTQCSGCIKR